MTQIRPTREQVDDWVRKWTGLSCLHDTGTLEQYIAEKATSWAMEEAAKICDAFNSDESNPLTTEGQCADAIRAAIPKEKSDE